MKIGLIPVSAKPYHAGHHALVTMAAAENDEVILFVSTSDRKRPGEFPIIGSDMVRVWQEELEAAMPPNVRIQYGGSPVRKVYETLGDASDSGSPDTYVVYSDPVDTKQNYPESNLQKYCGRLRADGQCLLAAEINPEAFTRGVGTPDVSGTKVRQALQDGNFKGFAASMPAGVDSRRVYDILTKSNISENVLRSYVSAILKG
jgi:hypothetical protein